MTSDEVLTQSVDPETHPSIDVFNGSKGEGLLESISRSNHRR